MKTARNWLAIVFVAAVAPILLMEFATRHLAPQDLSGSWLVTGPFGQTLNKPGGTVRHQFKDVVVAYRFNKWHQRGAEPADQGKRILVLGDSFTFGWLLKEEETYVARLQAKADAVFGKGVFQFLNASTGGWSPSDFALYIEAFGERIKPDLIVPFLAVSNMHRAEALGILKLKAPTGHDLVVMDQSANRSAIKQFVRSFPGYQWLLENSHLVQLVRTSIVKLRSFQAHNYHVPKSAETKTAPAAGSREVEIRRFARALFLRMKTWTSARNIPLTVMTTGWPYEYLKTHNYPWIGEEITAAGVDFIDLTSRVSGSIGNNLADYEIPLDRHPNARGAALIAEAAWPRILPRLKSLIAKSR